MKPSETIQVLDKAKSQTLNLALDTIERKKQALIFVNSKRSAEKTAEDVALKVKINKKEWNDLAEKALNALSKPTKQCKRLALCLKHGTAFHHAGLAQSQKKLIVEAFRKNTINIIACTPTLAAGVDLPAYRTIIRDVKRYSGSWGMTYIPVLEYLQMAGRAGRPGKEDIGEAILIAATEPDKEEMYEKYVLGEPEDIVSKLAVEPVLRTYVLSLISAKFVDDKARLFDFFSKTFWAHQYEDLDRLNNIIEKVVRLLEEFEFIRTSSDSDFSSANALGKTEKLTATLLGQRVAQLYIDPLTAHELIQGMKEIKKFEDFPILHLIASRLEMRPHLRVKVKEFEDIQSRFAEHEDKMLEFIPSMFDQEFDQFMNKTKTAFFMLDWIDESDEEYLLEKYDIRPGEIRVKLDSADWLFYSCEELARLMSYKQIQSNLSRLRYRLKYGVKEEIIPLLKLKSIGRVRARKLFNNKFKNMADLKKAPIATLANLIGPQTAVNIKEQLGEKIEQIPKGKRKGQLSLEKF